jgi:hypothetical protein
MSSFQDVEVLDTPQGTPEWQLERAGVITASKFGMVRKKVNTLDEKQAAYVSAIIHGKKSEKAAMEIAGYKAAPTSSRVALAIEKKTLDVGDWSEASINYAFRLASERIAGESIDDQFETYAMRRGRELEEPCRRLHQRDIGLAVDLGGFVRTKDKKFGFSADALVLEEGGGEYKCFYDPASVRPILLDGDWGEVADQVQGSLWISGRRWWDQCLYYPYLESVGKQFTRRRVHRDDNYIFQLEQDLVAFEKVVSDFEARLRAPREKVA